MYPPKHLQYFMISQPVELTESFYQILAKEWGSYFISLWNCNKELSALKEKEVCNVVDIITEVVDFRSNLICKILLRGPAIFSLCENLFIGSSNGNRLLILMLYKNNE